MEVTSFDTSFEEVDDLFCIESKALLEVRKTRVGNVNAVLGKLHTVCNKTTGYLKIKTGQLVLRSAKNAKKCNSKNQSTRVSQSPVRLVQRFR